MSSISSIAFSGLQTAAAQAQSSANTIASGASGADLADQIVAQTAAQTSVQLSLQMIRADSEATQQLVDILV